MGSGNGGYIVDGALFAIYWDQIFAKPRPAYQ